MAKVNKHVNFKNVNFRHRTEDRCLEAIKHDINNIYHIPSDRFTEKIVEYVAEFHPSYYNHPFPWKLRSHKATELYVNAVCSGKFKNCYHELAHIPVEHVTQNLYLKLISKKENQPWCHMERKYVTNKFLAEIRKITNRFPYILATSIIQRKIKYHMDKNYTTI